MVDYLYCIKNTIGALLVYDITDKDSFDKVRSWVNELFKCAG